MIRLGIVGCGESARSFAGASHLVTGLELVAVAGLTKEEATPLVETYGGAAMTIDEIAATELDCVAIATPPGVHAQHSLPFLRRGIHTIVEKPMALCVEDCDLLIAKA